MDSYFRFVKAPGPYASRRLYCRCGGCSATSRPRPAATRRTRSRRTSAGSCCSRHRFFSPCALPAQRAAPPICGYARQSVKKCVRTARARDLCEAVRLAATVAGSAAAASRETFDGGGDDPVHMRPLRKRPSAGNNQSGVLNPPCDDGDPRSRCMSTDPEARVAALTLHSMTLQVDGPRGACGPSAAARRGWYARTRRRRHALGLRCVATTILHRPGSWRARRTPRPRRGSEGDPVPRARIVALASTTHSHHHTRGESLCRVPCRRLNGDAACRRRPRPAPRGRSDDARPAALQRPEPPPTSGPTAVSRAR